jgi:hypothetical protein
MKAVTTWSEDGKPILQCVVLMGDMKSVSPFLLTGISVVPEDQRNNLQEYGVEVPPECFGEVDGFMTHPLMPGKPVPVKVKVRSVLVTVHAAEGQPPIAIYRQVEGEVQKPNAEIVAATVVPPAFAYPGPGNDGNGSRPAGPRRLGP